MDHAALILLAALAGGVLASLVKLPPLVGFLGAGFALSTLGVADVPALDLAARLGVSILLFGVGLKIDVTSLLRRQVWLTASAAMVVMTVVASGLPGILAALGASLAASGGVASWLLVGFALSFSSTVFVVKMLEERGSANSLGGRAAIGVLVVQDVAAVLFLGLAEGRTPSLWAPGLVLLIPAAWAFRPLLDRLGHGELLPLLGVVLALVPGYALFDAVGIEGDVGSLVVGMLLASHPRSGELAKSLFTVKDLLLVAFFLSIGLSGLPTVTELMLVAALLLILPIKGLVFAVLFWSARFPRRTSVLAGTSLANFSEFGLIVVVAAPASVLSDGWVTVTATAVAASFAFSSVVGHNPLFLVRWTRAILPDRRVDQLHIEDRPLDIGDARALVLGMGRVGSAAYERLYGTHQVGAIGVEADRERTTQLVERGLNVLEGDATDPEMWAGLDLRNLRLILLAMPFHGSNLEALTLLRARGYTGAVAVVAQYDDDLQQSLASGADTGLQLYDGAGAKLADRGAALLTSG